MPLLGNERRRRRSEHYRCDCKLTRCLFSNLAVGRKDLTGSIPTLGYESASYGWTNLMQAEREPRNDTEVATTAPDGPE